MLEERKRLSASLIKCSSLNPEVRSSYLATSFSGSYCENDLIRQQRQSASQRWSESGSGEYYCIVLQFNEFSSPYAKVPNLKFSPFSGPSLSILNTL